MYYDDKISILRDIFGDFHIKIEGDRVVVGEQTYPIVDDVIILLEPAKYPPALRERIEIRDQDRSQVELNEFAEDIQFTFGEEWKQFSKILPDHEDEFRQYFDIINLPTLKNSRVCDLGCGIGRWSYYLSGYCSEILLVDFSDAIFVARENLRDSSNALFFMGDITQLPFKNDFADFIFCIGVLHHLPKPALKEVRALERYAPQLLIYLYYALDNRPIYFRGLLSIVTGVRRIVNLVRNSVFRTVFTWLVSMTLYVPLAILGKVLHPFGLSRYVPLSEAYSGKSFERIRQDVYDRFFTRIEQRFSKQDILALRSEFSNVTVSNQMPYWHFLCER